MKGYIKMLFSVFAFALMFCVCSCEYRYNGAHIIAGELSGDVEIVWCESVSLKSSELTLKDGSHIRLDKGNFILYNDECPVCGKERR